MTYPGRTVLLLTPASGTRHHVELCAERAGLPPGAVCVLDPTRAAQLTLRTSWVTARSVVVDGDCVDDVVSLGLPRRDEVTVLVTSPGHDALRQILDLGARRLMAPADEAGLADVLELAVGETGVEAPSVGVVAGSGGAGASTLAVRLALDSARRQGSAALVDADPDGGGLDVLIGVEHLAGTRWSDLVTVASAAVATQLGPLPTVGDVSVLSWSPARQHRDGLPQAGEVPARTAAAALASLRSRHPFVVVDLARRPARSTVDPTCLTDVVLVVATTVGAVAAACHAVAELADAGTSPRLVVHQLRSTRLSPRDVGSALALPVAASYRTDNAVVEALDRGLPPPARGSLGAASRDLLSLWPGR